MEKLIKLRYPTYYKQFKCIGGKCEDSCCIGWDIDIDKTTFKQYFKVQDKEMKTMFQKNVHNNQYCTSPEVDYGRVKLKKGKRCPFLDDNNLCIIYSKIGEEYLSNVCTCYPRLINKIDDFYEISLDVACPEAAKIFLSEKDGISFDEEKVNIGKHIIQSYIDTNDKEYSKTLIKYFKEIRNKSIEIIKNRNNSLDERIYLLGVFLDKVNECFENSISIKTFIDNFDIDQKVELNDEKTKYVIQVSFMKDLIDKLNVSKEIDSVKFKEYTKKLYENYKFINNELNQDSGIYIRYYYDYTQNIFNKLSYIIENYLVNFMYNNLFPFTESEEIFDGYIMLLIRYSLIKFYLIGLNAKNKEEIIDIIQVFSKAVEHHKTYLSDLLYYLKECGYDNIQFAKTLL